jgi:ribonuclease P protein component
MNPNTTYRLRKHADYQLLYKRGRKQHGRNMAYFHALRSTLAVDGVPRRSDTEGARVGLTVPKALGGAVDRNRIKRRMREVVRKNLPLLTAAVDVILHPRKAVLTAEFATLEREVATIFRSIQATAERETPRKDNAA